MHRFFVPPHAFHGDRVVFPPEVARQMRLVLRLKPGDQVWALNGQGQAAHVLLAEVGKDRAWGRVVALQPATGEPSGPFILYPAISKGERFEWTLQKGVELGVTVFQPILTQRTVRRTPGPSRWTRWRRIIREAAEQSHRGRLPQLREPLPLPQALTQAEGFKVMPWVQADTPIAHVLPQAHWPAHLFIGPEGGFTEAEAALAREAGVHLVTLGPRILRTETAAVVTTALMMHALGELEAP